MKILFIAAHPDDIEYGCAGTIKLLREQGNSVYWILMTNGENDYNKTEKMRLAELDRSAETLEVRRENIFFLRYADGFISDNADTIKELDSIIRKIDPDVVCTHYYDDRHQDHRNTSYCVRSVCWGKYDLIYFRSFSTMNFEPNIFVDISDAIIHKREALNCYESQLKKYRERQIDFLEMSVSIDRKNGGNLHCMYAEGFIAANCVWKI